MTVDQLIAHFKGQDKVAAKLKVSQPAVSNWVARGAVPPLQQLRAQKISRGKLKADTAILR